MCVGGVVPVVNLQGVSDGQLKLTADLLAKIYNGDITQWNDPAIAAANAGVNLPAAGTVRAAAFLMSFHGGGTRNVYFLSLDRGLSPQLAVGIAGEFEAGGAEARVFDSTVSISFTYRLPPHRPSPKPDSGEPPPKPDSGGPIPKPDSGRP